MDISFQNEINYKTRNFDIFTICNRVVNRTGINNVYYTTLFNNYYCKALGKRVGHNVLNG